MKVFEDLLDELKEENLIEEAVEENDQISVKSGEAAGDQTATFKSAGQAPTEATKAFPVEKNGVFASAGNDEPAAAAPDQDAGVQMPFNENDFYRRRAMEEVSSLQMVERVFLGVEREQAKVTPKPYDDLAVSKALHDFLQVSKNLNSPESAAAEFKLMQETESWYSALSHRDQNILPVHLRRYCETTKPVLSSQALVALARFYRNSPYSESVRSKFDLIITRIFSQEAEGNLRQLAFNFDELVQHLSELYADWSSVPLYSTDDDSELSIIALKFEDFITEAVNASGFEELVKTDFFNRLRAFKESTGENFYAPTVAATAINCNIRVGNRYIELIGEEKKRNNGANLEDKYNFLLDQTISEATSKTLQLVQLLKEKSFEPIKPTPAKEKKPEPEKVPAPQSKTSAAAAAAKTSASPNNQKRLRINKWLLAVTVLTIVGNLALYAWVEYVAPQASSKEVQTLNLEGYYFKEYMKAAKITNETLIGIADSSWHEMSAEKKEEVLNNLLSVGKDKGFRSVRILGNDGKTIGYISAQNISEDNPKGNS